ncbi:hypothetical protein CM49_06521 [Paenibacillus sp. P1XP2]|nr:hypothetical protein CM49_06521 [Paenibacillus sp. P1XP2]
MKHSISILSDIKRIRDEVWSAYDAAVDPAALRAVATQVVRQIDALTNSSV